MCFQLVSENSGVSQSGKQTVALIPLKVVNQCSVLNSYLILRNIYIFTDSFPFWKVTFPSYLATLIHSGNSVKLLAHTWCQLHCPWKSQTATRFFFFGLLRAQLLMLLGIFFPSFVSMRSKSLICCSITGCTCTSGAAVGKYDHKFPSRSHLQAGVEVQVPGHMRLCGTQSSAGGRQKEILVKQKG